MARHQTQQPESVNPLELGAEELLLQDSRGYWETIWQDVCKRPSAVAATWVLLAMAALAILAPILANHRPYLIVEPAVSAEAAPDAGPGAAALPDAITIGDQRIRFPLFRSLRMVDWTLLSAAIALVWIFFWRKSLLRKRGKGHPMIVSLFAIFALTPIPWGLMQIPYDRASLLPESNWWLIYSGVGMVGFLILLWGLYIIGTGKKDQYKRDLTGPGLRRLFMGTVMIMIMGSSFGTLARPQLDRTDYYKDYRLQPEEGTWALFPIFPHDYRASEPYMRNQPPLTPELRIIASGGSPAAGDLKILDRQRDENQSLAATTSEPLSEETPLEVLNNGAGVNLHQSGSTDFTIVTHDLDTTRVRLRGSNTLGDVIDKINAAGVDRRSGKTLVVASIDPDFGIVLDDQTDPRPTHWVGTEDAGADVLSRILMATRVALSIGFVSTGIAVLIGVTFGAIIGYFGGWVDYLGMRIIEIFMAIPRLFLLLTIIAFLPPQWGPYMLYAMMVVIGLTSWMNSARFVRAEFFRLREVDFVQAAKACGLPLHSVLFKHMLPNGVAPVLVDASFGIAAAIFIETGLSFLGFGIKPPEPSWGQMLSEAIDPATGVFRWWLAIFPGIMIFLTVFSFNLIGDAMRDAIDPKLKKAAAI